MNRKYLFLTIGSIFLISLFLTCSMGGGEQFDPSSLPNRRLTEKERNAWIADYWKKGGPTAVELEVIRLINIEREKLGLSQVERHDNLMMAARFFGQQACDLKEFYPAPRKTHNFGPYADDPDASHGASANVAKAFGVNLAPWNGGNWESSGTLSASLLVDSWMNSEGHRNYIVWPGHVYIGVGQYPGGISYMYFSNRSGL